MPRASPAAAGSALTGRGASAPRVQGEPVVCEGCGGAGGVRCFACGGSGAMGPSPDESATSPEALRAARNVRFQLRHAGRGTVFSRRGG